MAATGARALPGEITSLAASADGRTVAYTTFGPRGGVYDVGVITGDRTRQWSVSAGAVLGMWHASVSSDGSMLAFMTQGLGRGTSVTSVTAVNTADGASLGTIASWDLGYPEQLSPVGGLLLSWDQDSTRAFLINPAARTRTALRLRGIPRVQYATLAW